jgi:hypothetical protein
MLYILINGLKPIFGENKVKIKLLNNAYYFIAFRYIKNTQKYNGCKIELLVVEK